jgi:catechol 2,3-dioxygenase
MTYGVRPPGFRLPDETRVGAVCLQVSDLERSLAFYEGLLGFDVVNRSAGNIQLGVGTTVLVELRAGATAPMGGKRLGLYHFAILLPDRPSLGRCVAHLSRAGVRLGASDHLVSEALYLSDPDGLGIEIYRDRPREEWSVRNGELAMATEPLDFESVLAAGEGGEWAGMPDGTTIGHVHLHVGNIEDAKRFYHEALGLDLTVWGYPGALFFSAGGYHHHLGTNTWAGPHASPPGPEEPHLVRWELLLPTPEAVAAAADSIVGAGYSATPEEVGGSVAADPWGTAVALKLVK